MAKRKPMTKKQKKTEKGILYGKWKIDKMLKPNESLEVVFDFVYGNKPKDKRFDWGLEKVTLKSVRKVSFPSRKLKK